MTLNQGFARPKVLAPLLMGLVVLWSTFGPLKHRWLFAPIEGLLFGATFLAICWHLVNSFRGFVSTVSSIGKPSHPRILGFAKWKFWLVAITIFIPSFLIFDQIVTRKMVVYQEAIKDVRASSNARETLGTSLTPGWFVESEYESTNEDGHAELDIPLSGTTGKGRLYAKGIKAHGQWAMKELYLVQSDSNTRVEIEH